MAETGNWSNYQITAAGRALRQRCIAEGKRPVFTRAAIGTGKPTGGIDNITSLVEYARGVIIKKSYAIEDNHLCIVRVDNTDYTQTILMTEVAVFAKIEGEAAEILYGYTYNIDGYVKIPAQTNKTNLKLFEITLDTCISISLEIQIIFDGSTVFVSHADLDDFASSYSTNQIELSAAETPQPETKLHYKIIKAVNWPSGVPLEPLAAILRTDDDVLHNGFAQLDGGAIENLYALENGG